MKRIPCATYRLQFNGDFTFQQAGEILDYLPELGISDVYASPLFEAGPQSTHGYDTCCFNKLNSGLGSDEDFEQFTKDLQERHLGLLLDFVPNHMSATLSNPWWRDVLENGRESPYASFFDIDWQPQHPDLRNKVLLPVLEDHYDKVLESGKLSLANQDGKFFVAYYERDFPINAQTLPLGAAENSSAILQEFNGTVGNRRSFDKLDALIQQQHYRLAYWRAAAEEINYRRFFDVTELVALKMELPEVFRATHQLLFDWLSSGKISGLRIDHPDGLRDPKEYLQRLQKHRKSVYVIVEKILSGDESLPSDWPVEGTTGYDFLNRANGVFVNPANASAFDEIYREFTGNKADFHEIAYDSKKTVLERSFASELNALSCRLLEIAARTRSGRNFELSQLRAALEEIIAGFDVYRTYIGKGSRKISAKDRAAIQNAISRARKRAGPRIDLVVFEFIERVLLLEMAEELGETVVKETREFVLKFQQLTGPAMAKGLEDTAFYRFNRLVSLNEVGGDPGKFGLTPDEFHKANSLTAKHWPHTLSASATHDTKRGEDLRARLNVLSEMPKEWREAVTRWSRLNQQNKAEIQNAPAPDANDEYLLYQTVVGAWPHGAETSEGLKSFRARVIAFMLKAAKEAKVNTSWTEPNAVYENVLQKFIERTLAENGNEVFLQDLRAFAPRVAFFGRINSLSQTLLKITSPGVPDFYQGGELSDLSLVDPDNRRPVDYTVRKKLLLGLKDKNESLSELLRTDEFGTSKLFLIWRALNFRKERRELFDCGDYVPLSAVGEKREHVCAFARTWKNSSIIVVVPRLVFGLTTGIEALPLGRKIWDETALRLPGTCAGRSLHNVLTQERVEPRKRGGQPVIEIGEALKNFPVALMETV